MLPRQPFLSVAVIVNVNVPCLLAVPDNTPLELNPIPVGNVPAVTVKVYGAVPPVAEIVWL